MENEFVEFLAQSKLKSIKRRHTVSIITNLFLIIVIGLIGVYLYMNIESFKMLNQDVCRLCESKTNGHCISGMDYNSYMGYQKNETSSTGLYTLNISKVVN